MVFRISPIYTHNIPAEDLQSPEALTTFLIESGCTSKRNERFLHAELDGFWFKISNPLISGLEGELMIFSPGTERLSLLISLNEGIRIHHENTFTT